ncbi:methyl-accepting chemotaxis protein, partial [Undibacterium luofuense]|nr:hypothetical protein [Undibacterium luofuense]
ISKIRPYETGQASLLSNKAVYIGDANPALVGKTIDGKVAPPELIAAVQAGKSWEDTLFDATLNTSMTRIFVPVRIGASSTPWSFAISVPEDKILAEVRKLRNLSILIGLISVAVVSAMLLYVVNKLIIRPLGGEPDTAVEIARRVAEGDLTTQVSLQRGDQHSMLYALHQMQEQLRGIVADIRVSSEFVSDASGEIAKGNLDLSQRTESQAASLAETASSVEHMHETVQNNAAHAERARQLSVEAA